MGCWFSLVCYVDDNFGDDRTAIGMIAIDEDGSSASAFTSSWDRALALGAGSTRFLIEFADEIRALTSGPGMTFDDLWQRHGDYLNAIQINEPSFADATAEEWVRDFGPRFVYGLAESPPNDDPPPAAAMTPIPAMMRTEE